MNAEPYRRIYKGRSMKGAFTFGDRLIFDPVPMQDVKPGDVILFRRQKPENRHEELVHRVMSSVPEGLIVRGDNNPCIDHAPVTNRQFLGKVVYIERNGKRLPVKNGLMGLLHARLFQGRACIRRRMWALVLRMCRGPYHRMGAGGLPGLLWRPPLKKVLLQTPHGPLVKYLHKNRTVALYSPSNGRFQCRKPYDLVLSKDQK